MKMNCDLRDHVQQKIYFFGVYEPLEMFLFNSCINPGDFVIDAGANVGIYTLNLATSVGENGKVFSFEPVPDNFQALSQNLQLSGSPKQVHIYNQALWNKKEILEFSLAAEHSTNVGSFTTGKVQDAIKQIKCQAIKLDDFIAENNIKHFNALKMDIEGAEKFAIQGSLESIKKFRPIVCMEINRSACEKMGYDPRDLIEPFLTLDYKIFFIAGRLNESQWINDVENIKQGNILLIPKEKNNIPNLTMTEKEIRKKYLKYS